MIIDCCLFKKDEDNTVHSKSFKVETFCGMQKSAVIQQKNFVVSHQSCISLEKFHDYVPISPQKFSTVNDLQYMAYT